MASRGDRATFGWSLTSGDGKSIATRMHVAELEQRVERLCATHFPRRHGYMRVCRRIEHPLGVRVRIERGDFFAEATLQAEPGLRRRGRLRGRPSPAAIVAIRMFGEAGSSQLQAARGRRERLVQSARMLGGALGLLSFGFLCWLSIGAHNPVFFLSGLLLSVALLVCVIGGSGGVGWIAEQIGDAWVRRAVLAMACDRQQRDDYRRFRSLARHGGTLRGALAGEVRGQPFRLEAPANDESSSRRLPAVTPSFSFSS